MRASSNHQAARYIAWCIVIGLSVSIMTLVPKESTLSLGFSVLLIAAIFFFSFRAVREALSDIRSETVQSDEAWKQSTSGMLWLWLEEAFAISVLATMGLLILYLSVQRLQRDFRDRHTSGGHSQSTEASEISKPR